jgi:4-alpha-glucanotransferase
MPIYVAMDSADTWSNSELFQLDEDRKPLRVAGCPPDPFAQSGQLWGNPLYRWDLNEKTGFAWWIERLRVSFSLYDVVRIDHFRGFESYFSIPAGDPDARLGEWVKGPGLAFVNAVNAALPGARIIAEDLGYLTDEVRALLAASGFPGMKVLQFAFDSREESDYMPYTYSRHCVAYTGTHDNSTALGWFKSAGKDDVQLAMDYLGLSDTRNRIPNGSWAPNWACIRAVLSSVADLAIVPMQDYLGLDDKARMNAPATLGGNNWRWRMLPLAASPSLAQKICRMTEIYGRRS